LTAHQIGMLLFDLAAILLIARVVGLTARRFGQPAVIGEIVAGIVLGPSVLGVTAGRLVFPPDVRPALAAVANVGLAIFMFIVGLELDRDAVRRSARAAALLSLASAVLPFAMGAALAWFVLARHDVSHHLLAFAVFTGAAMSITSFPVMARLLTDLRMARAPLGVLALTSGAIGNVIAWVMLTAAVALGDGGRSLWLAAFLPGYVLVMLGVVRPLLRRLIAAWPAGGAELLAVILAGLLLSGVVTQWLGLNYIFGAFGFGLIVPAAGTEELRKAVREQLGGLCTLLLLPVFFVVTGLQVDLRHVGLAGIGELAAILLVAFSGKYAGAFTAARLLGNGTRHSAALATLMNTRGVTELIVLSIGLQLGVLDHQLYADMVVMTVVTTAMAGPLLRLIYPRRLVDRDLAEAAPSDTDRRGQIAPCAIRHSTVPPTSIR
jgi:Kef-type K+ transport system membrane component KefB